MKSIHDFWENILNWLIFLFSNFKCLFAWHFQYIHSILVIQISSKDHKTTVNNRLIAFSNFSSCVRSFSSIFSTPTRKKYFNIGMLLLLLLFRFSICCLRRHFLLVYLLICRSEVFLSRTPSRRRFLLLFCLSETRCMCVWLAWLYFITSGETSTWPSSLFFWYLTSSLSLSLSRARAFFLWHTLTFSRNLFEG